MSASEIFTAPSGNEIEISDPNEDGLIQISISCGNGNWRSISIPKNLAEEVADEILTRAAKA